jgi:light-regulated signal transduction histidine kinase (bacteriophytochrome)
MNSILVVDDLADNLQVLADILIREGFVVRPVTSAAMAFRTMAAALPQLILADIKMPAMDGYEFCRKLKADPATRDIPVIFVSALGETRDKLRAFEAGGVDYLTKPFQAEEVLARVRTHLALHDLRVSLERRNRELEQANQELDAFSYSVSHDLRAPLRAVDGFSQALLEDCQDSLGEDGKAYLSRIRLGVQRMAQLIDDLLKLSRLNRAELHPEPADLSGLFGQVAAHLASADPARQVQCTIQPGMLAHADPHLLRVVADNLLGNAWKFTSKRADARVEAGETVGPQGERVVFVRDNGAGFAMAYADKLFKPFQRLHRADEFEGTGIGLATVQRIIHRHGGQVWAEAEPDRGATFFFSLPEPRKEDPWQGPAQA